ncbi:hypothetical protein SADUNF_Sadunf01G0072400 [Salix dunnii]|uniref:Uncharacterized protein n=1 Tax=Salix dunnii TaxID=1413687 RepID=A0A835TJK4_9ROSI|nr:hypothetical protein SADUNF_Sadunf01G0072400 [Salix dunnii]
MILYVILFIYSVSGRESHGKGFALFRHGSFVLVRGPMPSHPLITKSKSLLRALFLVYASCLRLLGLQCLDDIMRKTLVSQMESRDSVPLDQERNPGLRLMDMGDSGTPTEIPAFCGCPIDPPLLRIKRAFSKGSGDLYLKRKDKVWNLKEDEKRAAYEFPLHVSQYLGF